MRHKRMVGALIGQFANTSTLFFFLTWFPTYLVEQKHFALPKAGIMVTIPYLVALLGTLAAGSWSDWMLRRDVATTIARNAVLHHRPNGPKWSLSACHVRWLVSLTRRTAANS
jgi:MFS transporter, ACS family, D-galactonate transporter